MNNGAQGVAPIMDQSPGLQEGVTDRDISRSRGVGAPDSGLAVMILCWNSRRKLMRAAIWGLAISTIMAFAIPRKYKATLNLMPPDQKSGAGAAAMFATLLGKSESGLGSLAGDLLGSTNSG